jgi:hypothetical protein
MRLISELLAIETDHEGIPFDKEEAAKLYERLWDEFRASDVGIELIARGGHDIMDQVLAIYGVRYVDRPPAIAPVFEALEEIGNDLLLTLPERVAQARPKVNLNPTPSVREAPKPSKECSAFAHAYNAQMLSHGMNSLKPRDGYVSIYFDGKPYQYKKEVADKLLTEAFSLKLIKGVLYE